MRMIYKVVPSQDEDITTMVVASVFKIQYQGGNGVIALGMHRC